MSSIPVIGLPASDMVPGAPLQINFAAGLSGLGATALRALIIGNWIMATGAGASDTLYGPDTLVPMLGEDDAATLAGPRSEARRMVPSLQHDRGFAAPVVTPQPLAAE